MEILNLSGNNGTGSEKSSKSRAFIGFGVIAAAVGLSSTLAANISINSGPVEFGQGVAQTVACSGDQPIIVTPASSFINEGAEIRTKYIGADSGRHNDEGWIEVISTEGITVGMLVNDVGENINPDTVVIEVDGEHNVYLSKSFSLNGIPSGGIPVTFSESNGTPATLTPSYYETTTPNDYGGFSISSSTLAVGMLVTGPGISPNTVITWVGQDYIQLSKTITYTSGELTFSNSRSGTQGSFNLSDITVSEIPDTCIGKVFTIKIYDNVSYAPLAVTNWDNDPDNSFQVYWGNGLYTEGEGSLADNYAMLHFEREQWFTDDQNYDGNCIASGGCLKTAHSYDSSIASDSFRVILPLSIDARRVYKITVESQDDSDTFQYFNGGITTSSFNDFFWQHID